MHVAMKHGNLNSSAKGTYPQHIMREQDPKTSCGSTMRYPGVAMMVVAFEVCTAL